MGAFDGLVKGAFDSLPMGGGGGGAAAAKLGATKQALLDACDATARGTRSVRRHALAMAAATATYQRLFLLLWSRTTPPHAPTYLPRYRATQRWQRSKG